MARDNGRSRPKRRAKKPRRSWIASLRTNFFTGLIIVAPVVLTLYLTWAMVTFVDDQIVPLVPDVYNPATYIDVNIPGFGLFVFVLFTIIVGYFTKNLFGRQLVRFGESWMERIPIVRSIYNAIKQIAETVISGSGTSFQKACLVEYPRKGIWAIAFVSTKTKGELPGKTGEPEMTSVFLPTTPNPTSGFLLFVPTADIIELDMSVEEAAKLVISAGLVTPPTKEEVEAAARRERPRRLETAAASPKG